MEPENQYLADRISGKIDENGNPTNQEPAKKEEAVKAETTETPIAEKTETPVSENTEPAKEESPAPAPVAEVKPKRKPRTKK